MRPRGYLPPKYGTVNKIFKRYCCVRYTNILSLYWSLVRYPIMRSSRWCQSHEIRGKFMTSLSGVRMHVFTVVKTGQSEDKLSHRPVSDKSVPLRDSFLQEHGYINFELFFIKMFSVQLDGPVQPQHSICKSKRKEHKQHLKLI